MLDTATAEANLLSLLNDQALSTDDALSRAQIAKVYVSIMADLIRSGTVSANTTVTTAGSATTQTGTVTITNGKIS